MRDNNWIQAKLNYKITNGKNSSLVENLKNNFSNKYRIVLAFIITTVCINYFYSISMVLITTFTMAYLSKGSRLK